jgi:non-ribosomal peptide synthetase component F
MMVADAGIQLVLTESAYQGLFKECPAYDLAALESQLAEMPTTPPDSRCSADQLAYIMYTSGSTGQPKGVGVCHRNIVRLVCKTDYIAIKQSDRFLHLASVAFDAATFEIWAPLLNGACMVIYPSGPLDPALLATSLHNHKISVLWLTAGLFHQMVEMHAAALAQVNVILAGGDVLSPSHVQQLLAIPGARQVINGYGPTENTTFTCCHPMAAATAVVAPVPIGRPIANTQVYILDQNLQRVPGLPEDTGQFLIVLPNAFCLIHGHRRERGCIGLEI